MRTETYSEDLTATAEALRSGELDLLEYLGRLERRFEEIEPTVQAFVPEEGRFERLRGEAEALRQRFASAQERPALYGVPMGIKDIFHVDGFPTRAGSRLPPEVLAGPEAESVTRLKQAGALVLGKTVSTEFAYFAPGPTRNPRAPGHTPGGSSSGSAAAVAAGLCPLALGTQTIGSISRPASYCGVVGYKPSYDRIPRTGVIPLARSIDHVGLFTPEVAGAQEVARCLVADWRQISPETVPVVGVPIGPYLDRASEEAGRHFNELCGRLRAAAIEVRQVPAFADFETVVRRHDLLLAGEAAAVHADWFAEYSDLYDARTATLIRRGQGISEPELEAAREGRLQLRRELVELMETHAIDLWASPAATGPAPQSLESTGDPAMNLPWTQAGLPTVALPSISSASGLPLGLQLTGRWNRDEELLFWACGVQERIGE